MTRSLLFAIIGLALMGCTEPFITLPGDKLTGDVADPPAQWTAIEDVKVMQLETRPDNPYSVNVWLAALGSNLYLATGEGGTKWTEYLQQDRHVRLRIDGIIYLLEAVAVTDPAERERVAREYVRKYDLDVGDNWLIKGQVFRLDRR